MIHSTALREDVRSIGKLCELVVRAGIVEELGQIPS